MKRIFGCALMAVLMPALASAQGVGSIGKVSFLDTAPAAQLPPQGNTILMFGVFAGGEFDNDDWFQVGAHAMMPLTWQNVIVNPRLAFQPGGNGVFIVDVNVLKELQNSGQIRPFAGGGVAYRRIGEDDFSENDADHVLGVNLVAGAQFGERRFTPFVQFQHTILFDRRDSFAVTGGVNFQVK